MNQGRWYPGQVLLADGRSLTLSGYTEQAPGGRPTATSRCSSRRAAGGGGFDSLLASASGSPACTPPLRPPQQERAARRPLPRRLRRAPGLRLHLAELPRSSAEAGSGATPILNPAPPGMGSWTGDRDRRLRPRDQRPAGEHRAIDTTETFNANPNASRDGTRRVPQSSPLLPEHGPLARRIDGRRRRRHRGNPRRREVRHRPQRPAATGRAVRPGDRASGASARPRSRTAAITRPPSCCPAARCGRRGTTSIQPSRTAAFAHRHGGDLLAALPVQGHAAGDRLGARASSTGARTSRSRSIPRRCPRDAAVLVAPSATTHGADANQRLVKLMVREHRREQHRPHRPSGRGRRAARLLHALRSPPGGAVGGQMGAPGLRAARPG